MAGAIEWLLLSYRMPREPSTPRITVWRKLRKLGAVQLVDGLVALPASARNQEQFEWLADEVVDAGGEAALWVGRLTSASQERELASKMAATLADGYRRVEADAAEAAADAPGVRRRTLGRLRRELRRLAQQDHFPPPERERARQAVEALAAEVEPAP